MRVFVRFGISSWLLALAACSAASGTTGGPVDAGGFTFVDARADGGAPPDHPDAGRADAGMPGRCEVELCGPTGGGDGLDNDCDGAVDEDCPCVPGDSRSCFRGDPAGRGVGACHDGMMQCTGSLEFGRWGPCAGDSAPSAEICDPMGIDENCNGAANEGCACSDGDPPRPCGSDAGACQPGTQACAGGMLGACTGAVGPTPETCNDVDDDCDGMVDEDTTRECGSEVGECAVGFETCVGGEWQPCPMGMGPQPESCDGRDNDCDGMTDEELVQGCGSEIGACNAGMQTCSAGTWSECTGAVGPGAEECNGIDDDCDGMIDEDLMRPCGTDVGDCTAGVETCGAGAWGACAGSVGPATETCDGTHDEDCDGMTDEGCGCTLGATRPCGTDAGDCVAGTETCGAGGTWGACTGSVGPATETCDGTHDENCNGVVDEGCACTTGMTRPCGTDTGECVAGTQSCAAGMWGMCTGGVGPRTEVCDGVRDEDCDGRVDNGCACTMGMTRPCGTDTGDCVAGTETCSAAGAWGTCTGSVGPMTEVCDMRDNDCDAMTDEGGVCPTSPPVVACPGAITQQVLSTASLTGSGSDPDGGTVTYAWTVTARPTGSTANPTPAGSAATTFFLDASGSYTLQLCVTDDEGQRTCCSTTIMSTPRGALHVELSWSTIFGDVDLHLENVGAPADGRWFTNNDCFWANPAPDWGAVGAVANPTLDRDDTDGYGPENTTIDMMPQTGTYYVGVHYYCQHSIAPRSGGGSVAPGDGPTVATVRVYCDGALIATYTGLNLTETDDWITVARVAYPACTGMSVDRHSNGTSVVTSSYTGAFGPHCEVTCSTNADCPTGERCVSVMGGGPPHLACARI